MLRSKKIISRVTAFGIFDAIHLFEVLISFAVFHYWNNTQVAFLGLMNKFVLLLTFTHIISCLHSYPNPYLYHVNVFISILCDSYEFILFSHSTCSRIKSSRMKNIYFDSFLREIRVKMSNDTVHETFDVQKNAWIHGPTYKFSQFFAHNKQTNKNRL